MEKNFYYHRKQSVQKAGEAIFSRLVKQLSEKEGVTEALKAENQMLWVQRMNNRWRLFLFRQYSISHKVP
ncbi:TnpV protein [Coprococcus sp. BIOML-A1]|nr:TnpV protein [Coprococcus sp. BIOML-A1]MZK63534.1 TnpV protein [Coprococcus sp. BIOML-A2]